MEERADAPDRRRSTGSMGGTVLLLIRLFFQHEFLAFAPFIPRGPYARLEESHKAA
jgi:hypothetical protein